MAKKYSLSALPEFSQAAVVAVLREESVVGRADAEQWFMLISNCDNPRRRARERA
jgi:hypothetical protein